ncbi:MAG: acyl-CoA/acyl-ACP dehydrogenase [Planctomycetes bacterium]|nr:acyl-CoA/acyl-ACP dehydrogenase [Planctomycetota bacterium]
MRPTDAAASQPVKTPSFPTVSDVDRLAGSLADLAVRTSVEGPWRSGAFAALAQSGLLAAFIPAEQGGTAATEPGLVAALVAIAEQCLTTALALTQWAAAVRIIAGGSADVRQELLPPLARGDTLTTVGISQLTTSRRHLGRPALAATRNGDAWRLDGVCPWVTGADSTQTIVTGAATDDGGQAFFVVPTDAPGLAIDPPLEMLGLTGSRTSAVHFTAVKPTHILPPAATSGPRTGGLSTTALAVGAARASARVLHREAAARPPLIVIAGDFTTEIAALESRLLAAACGGIDPGDRDRLRADANGLVVRVAQAALTATKGAGFVRGHPVERLVRESLFFLVWSCPQAVTDAFLCDLTAG